MWKNININANLIEAKSPKNVKIKMPKNSAFAGYSFWHPAKLVRNSKHSAAVSLGYTDNFEFRLKQYGNGRYNSWEIIHEKTISAKEFESIFNKIDANICEREDNAKSYYYEEEPELFVVNKVIIPQELKN